MYLANRMTVSGLSLLYECWAAPPLLIKMVIKVKGDYRYLPELCCNLKVEEGDAERLSGADQSTGFYRLFLAVLFSCILQISQCWKQNRSVYFVYTHTQK